MTPTDLAIRIESLSHEIARKDLELVSAYARQDEMQARIDELEAQIYGADPEGPQRPTVVPEPDQPQPNEPLPQPPNPPAVDIPGEPGQPAESIPEPQGAAAV